MPPLSLARAGCVAAFVLASALGLACDRTPDDAAPHLARGDAALADGRYPQALAAYSHAHDLARTDPAVQRAIMCVRVHLIAEVAARIRPEAMEDAQYEASLLLETDKARAHVYLTALGNVLLRKGDVEGAKAKYAEALQADPTSAFAHRALGLVLMSRKETAAQAKSELALVLKVKPADGPALVGLGQLELAEGNLVGAAEHLEAALRVRDDFDARMALGRARLQQQKMEDAATHFQRAAELDPKSAAALSGLGQALLAAGKPEDAERALQAALQIQPDPEAWLALGFALARQQKAAAALEVFVRILAGDPAVPPALYGAGTTSEQLGRSDDAMGYYRRLLALSAEGPAKQMITDAQREALARVTALATPPPSGSTSVSASASASPAVSPQDLSHRR